MDKYLRLKPNIRICEEENELLFIGTYGKALILKRSRVVYDLLELLRLNKSRNDIIRDLSHNDPGAAEKVGQLIDRLLTAGILEYFTFEEVLSKTYIHYQTQLSFFDLLQPMNSVSEKTALQERLRRVHILVVGCGGIGCAVLQSLTMLGIGMLSCMDNDTVEGSNLNRQFFFTAEDLEKPKACVIAAKLRVMNPDCTVLPLQMEIDSRENLEILLQGMETRPSLIMLCADTPAELPLWVNSCCEHYRIPFLKCSYQGLTGFIGPLVIPGGRSFTEIVNIQEKESTASVVNMHNSMIRQASFIASNSIIANMAVLEATKYLLGIPGVNILEKRIFLDMDALAFW